MLFEGFVENIELKRQTMRNNARKGDCSYCFYLLMMVYLIVKQGWLGSCVLEYMTSISFMNPYCTRIRVLLNAVHIDSLFYCAENQFFVDNSTTNSSIIDSLFRSLGNCLNVLFYSFLDSITLRFREYSECCVEFLC